ncbi:MAG: mechanosensitive ion channel [Acidobacteria bacterium]|nr:mechanosensitive ion channel [Acidobacteriota bacterium]
MIAPSFLPLLLCVPPPAPRRLLLALLLGGTALSAQVILPSLAPAPGKPPAAAQSSPPSPEVIAVAEIPDRIQTTAALLRAATARALPQPHLVAIERDFPVFRDGCQPLAAATREALKTERSAELIANLRNAWMIIRLRVSNWQNQLRLRNTALQGDYVALARESASWEATSASAAELELPPAILAEIAKLRASIDETRSTVAARRNTLLQLQSAISQLSTELDRLDEEIKAAADVQRGEIFRFDGSPIWRPEARPTAKPASAQAVIPSKGAAEEVVKSYFSLVFGILAALLLLFLAVLSTHLVLRPRARSWVTDQNGSIRALGQVVLRPVTSSILVTVAIALIGAWEIPGFLRTLLWYLLLIPLLRLVPRLLAVDLKSAIWTLAALFAAEGLLSFLPPYALSARLLVLGISAVAISGLWRLQKRLLSSPEPNPWARLAAHFAWFGIALFGAAIAAEIFGAISLSRFLKSAALQTIYGSVVLYGCLLVVYGIVELVLRHTRPAALSHHWQSEGYLRSALTSMLNWLGLLLFLILMLAGFSVLEPSWTLLVQLFARKFSLGAIQFSLGSVAIFFGVVFAAAALSRLLRLLLSAGILGRLALQRGTEEALSKLLHYAILTVGFFLAIGAAGIDMTKITVLAGALGVGVGIGLQNIVNNFLSGLILLFERPIHVGDKITVGQNSGEVKDIGIRASTITTWDGADVVIPNANLISSDFTNWTLTDERRRGVLKIGVAYGTETAKVLALLQEAAASLPAILHDPPPTALFAAFGASSLDFTLHYWTLLSDFIPASSDLHVAVNRLFARENIEIPFPQHDIHVRPPQPPPSPAHSG